MSIVTDLYTSLFGRTHIANGDVISMSEHGRVGGLSTGQAFKHSSIIDKDSGSYLKVNSGGGASVYQENHICTDNTTTTPLGSGATFTGVWQDCLEYQEVNVSVDTDQNSATNGLVIQWSADGETIADTDVFSVYANAGTNYTPNPAFRYVRIVYTNGSVAQTRFNLMTILRRGVTGGSFHRIDSTLKDDSDARLNITIPKLKTAANTYVSQTATTAGNAKMSLEELESDVSDNNKTQLKTTSYMKTGDTTYQVPRLDVSTHTLQTIEYEHHEIHAGSHFYLCDYDSAIQLNETIEFVVTTPNTTSWSHMTFDFSSILGASLDVYEGSTDVVGGTPVTPFNNNRNSATTSTLTLIKDPTSITTGTRIAGYLAGANRTGGMQQRDRELILKQNTTYLFRFTSLANSNAISFCGEWYDNINKVA